MKYSFLIIAIVLPFLCKSQNEVLSKYHDLGIPSLNKAWSPEEYKNTINLLNSLSKEGQVELPNNTNESKAIISKITDFENYWFFNSEIINDKDKILYLLDIQKPLIQLYFTYYSNSKKTNEVFDYSNEITLLQSAIVKMMGKQLELTDLFLVNHPNLNEVQKEGLQKMKFGLNTFISGSITIIKSEFSNYIETDICNFSKVFFDFYRKNRNSIDNISKIEFDKNIIEVSKNHKIECIKKLATIN